MHSSVQDEFKPVIFAAGEQRWGKGGVGGLVFYGFGLYKGDICRFSMFFSMGFHGFSRVFRFLASFFLFFFQRKNIHSPKAAQNRVASRNR